MKIANEHTLNQFDRLKDQFTAHLRKSPPKSRPPKNPMGNRFRWVLPLFLVVGGGYLLHRNTPTLQEYLLEKGEISYQQTLAWRAIETYLRVKWMQVVSHRSLTPSSTLANQSYITRLESDLLFLNERAPEKKLHIETRSTLALGFLSWENEEKTRFINPYGDLVERHRTSKLMLGNWIRIWGKSTDKLLRKQRIFAYYERELQQIGMHCEAVNWLAQWQLGKEQHAMAIEQCRSESKRVGEKLRRVVEERLRREKKLYG